MTVAWWFTLSSGLALPFLMALTREFWLDRRAMIAGKKNGAGLAMTTLLLVAVGGLTFIDAMLVVTGLGSVGGVRALVYVIVAMPAVILAIAFWIYYLRTRVRHSLRHPAPPK